MIIKVLSASLAFGLSVASFASEAMATLYRYQVLHVPGSVQTYATNIDDSGAVTGWFVTDQYNYNPQGFIYDQGAYTITPTTVVSGTSSPTDISSLPDPSFGLTVFSASQGNSSGIIIGTLFSGQFLTNTATYYWYTYYDQSYMIFSLPIRPASLLGIPIPEVINDSGTVAGYTFTGSAFGLDQAFAYSDGSYTILKIDNSPSIRPTSINDRGQIVGTFGDGPNNQGFIATPIPELPTWGMVVLSFTALGFLADRRRRHGPSLTE